MNELNEWVEINIPFDTTYSDNPERPSFKSKGFAKPGVLIEYTDPTVKEPVIKQALIGDINSKSGKCECCGFWSDIVVLRYKQVWKPDDNH